MEMTEVYMYRIFIELHPAVAKGENAPTIISSKGLAKKNLTTDWVGSIG